MEARQGDGLTDVQTQLLVRYGERSYTVDAVDSERLVFGSANGEVRVQRDGVSRSHAEIVFQNQSFILVDHSTNGTYVQTEDRRVTFLRRGTTRLWGEGWISLGEPLQRDHAIRFGVL